MEQIKLIVDSLNEAITDTCKAIGKKRIAKLLFPDKSEEEAARYLNDCLNPDRPQKLSGEQIVLIAREARKSNCDIITPYICADVGYAAPVPVDPEDERARLQRDFIDAVGRAERLGKLITSRT